MGTTHLSKTLGTPTGTKKLTISFWVKRTKLGASQILLNQNADYFYFHSNDYLDFEMTIGRLATNRLFRDPSSFYHIVIAVDTTLATADDRIKMYINGVQETSFQARSNPSQDATFADFNTAAEHTIGKRQSANDMYFDGLLTHYHFIDGIAYAATDFGESDSTSGIWKPKTAPSVTYGNNGFFLKFENSGAMGTDSSGNSNTFTVSGTLTQNVDTPSNNFATGNPIANGGGNLTFTNGNTTIYDTDSTWRSGFGGLAPSSGKYYFEVKHAGSSSNVWIGIMDSSQLDGTGAYKFMEKSRGYGYSAGGEKGNNNSTGAGWGASYTQNDIIGVAMDLDNNKIYFSKNGTWQDSGDPTSGATGTGSMYDLASGYNYFPATSLYSTSAGVSFNFGNGYFGTTAVASSNSDSDGLGLFEYSVPSGYYALCTKNIKNYG